MSNLILADLLVMIHFGFILFVVFGGLLVYRYKKVIYFHIPALIWGVLIEFYGWICPLTVMENKLRSHYGYGAYSSGFIEHYIIPVIYPVELTTAIQIILSIALILFNIFVYGRLFLTQHHKDRKSN